MFERTKEIQEKYDKYRETKSKGYDFFLDKDKEHLIIEKYNHWGLIENEYPYDISEHHILYPLRKCKNLIELLDSEIIELLALIKIFRKKYDHIVINSEKLSTIQTHFHLHLINK